VTVRQLSAGIKTLSNTSTEMLVSEAAAVDALAVKFDRSALPNSGRSSGAESTLFLVLAAALVRTRPIGGEP
jgi:hypothetical protein